MVKKEMLLDETRQYNIHIFHKIIFFKYRTRQIKPTETNKEGNVLFNDTLNILYLQLYCERMVKDSLIAREETCYHHMGYTFRLAARILLYAPYQETRQNIPQP